MKIGPQAFNMGNRFFRAHKYVPGYKICKKYVTSFLVAEFNVRQVSFEAFVYKNKLDTFAQEKKN